MQVLIDIPKKLYNRMKTYQGLDDTYIAVKHGTPLPKGHGDLIDRKELLKQPMDKANYPSNYVKIAPTIIEADKAESEGKE